MKTYRVNISYAETVIQNGSCYVEAENEDEAKVLAMLRVDEGRVEFKIIDADDQSECNYTMEEV